MGVMDPGTRHLRVITAADPFWGYNDQFLHYFGWMVSLV